MSCAPNPAPALEPLPACQERRYHVVVVDQRALDSFSSSTPVALNGAGQVAGTWNPGSDLEEWEAYFWQRGARTDFHQDAGLAFSFAADINAHGTVVGRAIVAPALGAQPFIWSNGEETRLDVDGQAHAVNDRGDVAGTAGGRSFVYTDGTLHFLPTAGDPPGFNQALDINNHRQVIGVLSRGGEPGLYLFSCGEVLDLPVRWNPTPYRINDRGQIVGTSEQSDGSEASFLYENGELMPLPAELVPAALNNRGEVAGGRYLYADGQLHDVQSQVIDAPCWSSFEIHALNDHGDLAVEVRPCPGGDDDGRDAVVLTMNPERYQP